MSASPRPPFDNEEVKVCIDDNKHRTGRRVRLKARHKYGNRNIYPIDPKINKNPLEHLKYFAWITTKYSLPRSDEFFKYYRFETQIHKNTTSNVFVVRDIEKCGYAIIKIYDINGDRNIFNRVYREFIFVRETELMDYADIFYNDKTDQLYILQPIYSTLRREILENRFTFNENEKDHQHIVKGIIFDLLDKLWIIHNCGYVHGDVKPDNIVKKDKLNDINHKYIHNGWKLIDFDRLKKNKSTGKYAGTAGWTAPEINSDSMKNKYLYSSDIWSLGLVLLYLLFGKQPFDITDEEKRKYGQNDDFIESFQCENNDMVKINKFKQDLKQKMIKNWYHNKLLKSENMIKNYLVSLYYDNKISLNLFELLHDGMLVYDPNKRWNCQQIYNSKWFDDIRDIHNTTKNA